jgi:protoporphyrinogen oxidase
LKRIAVVGGGFRGILLSALMNREGHQVTLLETAKKIGGILKPKIWDEFSLDIGIQLFDNFDADLEEVIRDICGSNIASMDINYASYYNGTTTDSFAILDLSSESSADIGQNIYEMTLAAGTEWAGEPQSLGERNLRAFGKRAGSIVNAAAERMLLIPPEKVEPEYLSATPFNRIRVVPDNAARVLKQAPELDNSIAMSRKSLGLNDAKNFYPKTGGMASFCKASESYCHDHDIDLKTGVKITSIHQRSDEIILDLEGVEATYDAVIWTSGIQNLSQLLLSKQIPTGIEHVVPMVIYYFRLRQEDAGPYTYVQNHDPELDVFRCSTQGVYSNQINDRGETYVCAESTTPLDYPRWHNPENFAETIWQQCKQIGAVRGDPIDSTYFKIPATYRAPLQGYRNAIESVMDAAKDLPGLVVLDQRAFTRSAIFSAAKDLSIN